MYTGEPAWGRVYFSPQDSIFITTCSCTTTGSQIQCCVLYSVSNCDNIIRIIIICISYVTAVRYVAAINHEARGRAAPEGE